jgi:hypothetical protein
MDPRQDWRQTTVLAGGETFGVEVPAGTWHVLLAPIS